MKNITTYVIALAFVLCATLAVAQPATLVTYEMKLEVADQAAQDKDYYGAIEWFQKAYKESKDPALQVVMADMYKLARDYKRAMKGYERVLRRDERKKEYQDVRLDLGRMYKYQGMYKEALNAFNIVIADPEMDDAVKAAAKAELAGIEAMESMSPNHEAVVYFLPVVNSSSAESAPAISPDGELYFSSFNRKREIILDGEQGDYHAKLYKTTVDKDGEYEKAQALPETINRPDFNMGGVSFSRDGNKMYFTRATLQNNGLATSDIFVSVKNGQSWGAPVVIEGEINSPDFLSMHPYEGELYGKKVLFFSSNMDGSLGGFDLFYSEISGDTYGIPVNLGETINTSKDEVSPYYRDGVLYFSSDGHPTMGGKDIFFATWSGSKWEELTNMGYNYNSPADDLFLRFDDSGVNGFLVSNRPNKKKKKIKGNETCCDDIYGVTLKELVIDLFAEVYNEEGKLAGAKIELSDLTLGSYPDTKSNFNGNDFNFSLEADRNYKALISMDGYYPDSITFNTVGILDDYTVKKKITLKAKPPVPEEPNVTIVTINEPIRLGNIYYDFDDAKILPDAEKDLNYLLELMEQYPDMVIELSSHTDSQGKDSYNRRLSQRRASSAKKYLTNAGVASDRIKAVGYGEKFILNHCTNDQDCSDDEHRVNRRTEFKILEGPQTIEIKKEVFQSEDEKKK